jgi:hypothetical protein
MTDLNLVQNKIRPRDKKLLGEAVFNNPKSQLKYFACNEWKIGPDDTSLSLSKKDLGAHDFVLIAGLLSKNPKVEKLDLSFNHGACGSYQGSGQYDESVDGIHAICDALLLPDLGRVTSLNLAGNNIKAEGCYLLAQLLERNTELKSLDLSCNQLLMSGPASVDLGSFEAFCEALKGTRSLASLNLSETSLCAYRDHYRILHGVRQGVHALCAAVQANQSLTKLNASRNFMGHEDVIHLTEICSDRVRRK